MQTKNKKENDHQFNKSLENQMKTLEANYSEAFKELKSKLFETVTNLEVEKQKKN
jgi:DNA-binding ferritin-like protein (Dps family)